jgi:hypothetical protein
MRITLDDSLSYQLGQMGQPVELFNAAGLSLGHFVPGFKPRPEDNCPYAAEELAAMRLEKGEHTLDEIWRSLGVR